MVEIQTYATNWGNFNFIVVLIIVGTCLSYEVGRAISVNDDDDQMVGGMIMRAADGAQAWIDL